MATKTYTLTFASLGADLDNFSLTSNGGAVTPNSANRTQLLEGLTFSVNDTATVLTITSSGWCSNSFNVILPESGSENPTPVDPVDWGSCYEIIVQKAGFNSAGPNWTMTVEIINNELLTKPLNEYDYDEDSTSFTINVCSGMQPVFNNNGILVEMPNWISLSIGGSCYQDGDCVTP
jgi:hypothetical protein